jgi:hypothetical protein
LKSTSCLVLRVPLFLLLFLTAGCGVADYERMMAYQQRRLDRFDEETKYLGAALVPPRLKPPEQEPPLPDVYLRPPKNIRSTCEPRVERGFLYRYPREVKENIFIEMYLGRTYDRIDVLNEGRSLYSPVSLPRQPARITRKPFRGPALSYNMVAFEEREQGSHVFVYAYQADKAQIVIVYRVEKGNQSTAARAIDYSLDSLVVGPRATELRATAGQDTSQP